MENRDIRQADENGLLWYRPQEAPFKLAGFHWFDQDHIYRRLPLHPPLPLPPAVERVAATCAGGQVKFVSDTATLVLKVKLHEPFGIDCVPFASPHGPEHAAQTCVSGFDLYLGPPGAETFYAVTRFPSGATEYECRLLDRASRDPLVFTLNFPLHNGVDDVLIGLPQAASRQEPPPYRMDQPVVVYGTSIVQGGCASRPGTCYPNILSRWLNVPFLNLGFSGSGKGEPQVAEAIALVRNPALFVLDYEANVNLEGLVQTMPGFIARLRAKHPLTPVLVVSKIRNAREAVKSDTTAVVAREQARNFQRALVKKLRAAGDKHVHFLDGSKLLGPDYHECSVDGVHVTDRGFFRMANAMHPTLEKLLFG